MSSDGSNEQQLTDTPALDALPAYSPNGASIVFESDRGAKNNRDLYVADARGGNQHRLFADSRYWDVAPSWGVPCGTSARGKCDDLPATIHADVLFGTAGNDVICGGAGNDATDRARPEDEPATTSLVDAARRVSFARTRRLDARTRKLATRAARQRSRLEA